MKNYSDEEIDAALKEIEPEVDEILQAMLKEPIEGEPPCSKAETMVILFPFPFLFCLS